jgi:DNA modification methylase
MRIETIGNATLYLGDCMDVLPTLGGINLVITSPPYFNARDYSFFKTYEEYSEWCDKWVAFAFLSVDKGRMVCINCSPVIEPRLSRITRSKRWNVPNTITNSCERAGAWFCEDLTWEKPDGAAVNRGQRFYLDRHPMQWRANATTERIICYQKPTNELNDKIISRKCGDKVSGDYPRTEVWRLNPETKINHPAPFPVKIPYDLARLYSWPDETILDPFMGSGTTGVAASQLGRKFVGIERDPKYFDMACERIENAMRQSSLFGDVA